MSTTDVTTEETYGPQPHWCHKVLRDAGYVEVPKENQRKMHNVPLREHWILQNPLDVDRRGPIMLTFNSNGRPGIYVSVVYRDAKPPRWEIKLEAAIESEFVAKITEFLENEDDDF